LLARHWLGYCLVATLLLLLGLFYARHQLWFMPQGIHEWAQADRLSIALSYTLDDGAFWQTRTFSYFPVDRRVGVEWQIQGYLAGQIGKVWGQQAVSPAFRTMTLVFSVLGLAFWGWTVGRFAQDWLLGLLLAAWLLSSPDLLYYAANYLNEPFALGLILVALGLLWRHHRQNCTWLYSAALGVATLAVLVRPHVGAYWVAVMLYPCVAWLATRRLGIRWPVYLGLVIASGMAVGLQLYYIRWVSHTYNSHVFASSALPFDEWSQVQEAWQSLWEVWLPEFFTPIQLVAVGLTAAGVIIVVFWQRAVPNRTSLLWGGLTLLGVLLVVFLFGIQLRDHDYYYLSLVFPLLYLLWGWAWFQLHTTWPWLTLVPLLALPCLIFSADRHHQAHIQHNYRFWADRALTWEKAPTWLASTPQYDGQTPLLVLNEVAPNLSLVYLGKPGLAYHPGYDRFFRLDTLINRAGLGYVLIADDVFHDPESHYPTLRGRLELLRHQEGFRLYRLAGSPPK